MEIIDVVETVFLFLVSGGAFVISYFQFKEKGYLFNNAYLFASKEQKESMNKSPHYRQSAIVFLGAGIIFALMSINIFVDTSFLVILNALFAIALLVYIIVSSLRLLKN